MNGFSLSSTIATIIYFLLMTGAYVWATLHPGSPFLAFATQMTIGYVAYIAKRLVQKKEEYVEKNDIIIGD